MRNRILTLLEANPTQTFPVREILKRIGLSSNERQELRGHLEALVAEGRIRLFRNRHYGCGRPSRAVVGILSVTPRGVGFVAEEIVPTPKGDAEPSDVMISRRNMGTAIHGDRVEAHIVREQFGRREGYVVRVLERRTPTLVGRFLHQRKGGMVLPREPRIDRNIVISASIPRKVVKDDQWVVVRITQWTAWPEPLYGQLEEVLGSDGDPGLDVLLIVRDHGVTAEFPKPVEREAAELPAGLGEADLAGRRDLRSSLVVTIDPARAKDFDDAVSVEVDGDGLYRLGVHIADVSHYVEEGTEIDAEALERATSIYPVDRVIPMLPERLSNELCSLRPREDRPAMSVVMEIDKHGRVRDFEVFRSVIHSRHRLTYKQVQDLFDGSPSTDITEFADAHLMLFRMRDLAKILAARRRSEGSLDLDIPEPEVQLDDQARVVDFRRSERWESHRLVEQFMILANEMVARYLTDRGLPVLYRIHEPPRPEKLERLIPFLKAVGVHLPPREKAVSHQTLQSILDRLDRLEAGSLFHTLVLRVMMRAVYSPKNLGHFGLASDCYCHFTSPIRRYPDLVVHRVLAEALAGKRLPKARVEKLNERMDEFARHSTQREERADEIERDTVKVKSLEFMRQFVGEEFEGIVSGVTSFGFFVELVPYPVEGLVHMRALRDDYYHFDEESLSLVGEGGGRRYRFGDKVTVAVTRVDLINLQMDLVPADLVDELGAPRGRRGKRHGRPPKRGRKPPRRRFRKG